MTDYIATDTELTSIANAIRTRGGTSASLEFPDEFISAIYAIDGGSEIHNQNKTVSPTESQQSVTADSGYTGLGTVTVNAISSSYVGSGITRRSSSDLTASGATVTAPSGYYESSASKAVASGSAIGPSSISQTGASISVGTNALTFSKTNVSTTPTVSAGYISSATASTATVSLTASVTTKAAATYHPSSSNQTISASQYLAGIQTINAVTTTNLSADNILSGVTIKVGDSTDDDCVASVTGNVTFQTYYTGSSAPSASLGVNGDIYLQS